MWSENLQDGPARRTLKGMLSPPEGSGASVHKFRSQLCLSEAVCQTSLGAQWIGICL